MMILVAEGAHLATLGIGPGMILSFTVGTLEEEEEEAKRTATEDHHMEGKPAVVTENVEEEGITIDMEKDIIHMKSKVDTGEFKVDMNMTNTSVWGASIHILLVTVRRRARAPAVPIFDQDITTWGIIRVVIVRGEVWDTICTETGMVSTILTTCMTCTTLTSLMVITEKCPRHVCFGFDHCDSWSN